MSLLQQSVSGTKIQHLSVSVSGVAKIASSHAFALRAFTCRLESVDLYLEQQNSSLKYKMVRACSLCGVAAPTPASMHKPIDV